MLSIKEIDNIRGRLFDAEARNDELNAVFGQSIAYVSLVEKIKGLEPATLSASKAEDPNEQGLAEGFNDCLAEIKSFIDESGE